jgi:hypothetical protein
MRSLCFCAVALALVGCFQRYDGESNVVMAIRRARDLADGIEAFQSRHGRFPGALEELVEVHPGDEVPFLPRESLTDPWGQPYLFVIEMDEAGAPHAVVFTTGPRGQHITNLTAVK